VFHPLTRLEIRKIVGLQIALLQQRLVSQNWNLEITDAAQDALADEGYDPAYGARPLKRVIQNRLANPLATEILKSGSETGSIRVDFDEEFRIGIEQEH